jgi:dolichol-phosphate mannosyltransferase
MKLSVVVPMFNEERFIIELLSKLLKSLDQLEIESEVLVVDDGSTDKSRELVSGLFHERIKLLCMPSNSGKGAAVRYGVTHSSGDLVLVQDADLEYDTEDIKTMINECQKRELNKVSVYGSRIAGAHYQLTGWRKTIGLWPGQGLPQRAFNLVLSLFHFFVSRVWVSDLLTGYKVYPKRIFDDWETQTSGFETDHEITMQLHKLGIEIVEVPVSYTPRSKSMGKKITSRDAVKALTTIWRYRR